MTLLDQSLLQSARAPARAIAPIWRLAVKRAQPIVAVNAGDSGPPLYAIHPVTGDVVGLQRFGELLRCQRLIGIQVPLDAMKAEFARSIDEIARRYVAMLTDLQPEGPINLVGWSAGAIIALEMAHQLRALGRVVPLLVAFDGAPCNTGAGLKAWHPLYILRLISNLPRWVRDDLDEHDWSPRGIWHRLESKLAIRFGIGARRLSNEQTLDCETIQKLLDVNGWHPDQKAFMYAMYKAMLDYVPAPYDGKVIVYETTTQPLFHLRQIGAAWTAIAANTEIVSLDGNHSAMIRDPLIGTIARHLLARLAEI